MQEHWALVRNDAIPALLVVLKVRLQLAKAHEIFIYVNEQGSHGRSVENGLLTGLVQLASVLPLLRLATTKLLNPAKFRASVGRGKIFP